MVPDLYDYEGGMGSFDRTELMDEVKDRLSPAALLESLAEEAAELAQAALKKARYLRGENPTPKTLDELDANLIEEMTDVYLCSQVLWLWCDMDVFDEKLERWIMRLNRRKTNDQDLLV